MKNWFIYSIIITIAACKGSDKEEENNAAFFPVSSFIKSQVADVDSSVYPIYKIETVAGRSDSGYISKDEFKKYTNDFLDMPDITQKKWKGDYIESKVFDDALNSVILSYNLKDEKDNAEVRKQEVIIEPNQDADDKVKTIIIDRISGSKNDLVRKHLLWQVDKRFQIVTISNNDNKERVHTVKIFWKDIPVAKN
ncbi:MAG: hypothetical protein H0V91_04580 [Flavisolibacter sp.]|jgi:hypothetical protein|nr:hypothetical protein [Flavisolibacter sp.]